MAMFLFGVLVILCVLAGYALGRSDGYDKGYDDGYSDGFLISDDGDCEDSEFARSIKNMSLAEFVEYVKQVGQEDEEDAESSEDLFTPCKDDCIGCEETECPQYAKRPSEEV